eukprot:1158081-Pelagomonas_calceolata.AAC.4
MPRGMGPTGQEEQKCPKVQCPTCHEEWDPQERKCKGSQKCSVPPAMRNGTHRKDSAKAPKDKAAPTAAAAKTRPMMMGPGTGSNKYRHEYRHYGAGNSTGTIVRAFHTAGEKKGANKEWCRLSGQVYDKANDSGTW